MIRGERTLIRDFLGSDRLLIPDCVSLMCGTRRIRMAPQAEHAYGQMAQGGHHTRTVTGPDLGAVPLVEHHARTNAPYFRTQVAAGHLDLHSRVMWCSPETGFCRSSQAGAAIVVRLVRGKPCPDRLSWN